jgi:uncharacterized protein
MHFVVSPAKTLDFDRRVPTPALTRPRFLADTIELIETLKGRSVAQIGELMQISPALAELNVRRFADWRPRFTDRNSRPAVMAFDGDVYDGLDAKSLTQDDLAWAQQHVSILSGLYGLLRPLDRLQAYRLEMGTPLPTSRGHNLYAFWGDRLARQLDRETAGQRPRVLVNLASQEYFKAVQGHALKARVVDCVFEDWSGGEYKVVSFFAKRARGAMLRHAIVSRLADPAGLLDFQSDGYRIEPSVSEPGRLVFRRRSEV